MPAPPSWPSALWMRTFEMVTVVSSEAPAPPPMAAPPLLNAPSFLMAVWVTLSHEPMVPLEMVTVAPAPRPPPMPAPPFLPSSLPTAFFMMAVPLISTLPRWPRPPPMPAPPSVPVAFLMVPPVMLMVVALEEFEPPPMPAPPPVPSAFAMVPPEMVISVAWEVFALVPMPAPPPLSPLPPVADSMIPPEIFTT